MPLCVRDELSSVQTLHVRESLREISQYVLRYYMNNLHLFPTYLPIHLENATQYAARLVQYFGVVLHWNLGAFRWSRCFRGLVKRSNDR